MWSNDPEILAEFIEKRIDAEQAPGAVEIKQRLTAAALLHLDVESSSTDLL
jgi:hypothetical protein